MKKAVFPRCHLAGTLILILIFQFPARAQKATSGDKEILDSLLISEKLDTLPGFPVTLFSHGYEIRARAVQNMVSDCIKFYQDQYPADHYTVQIEMLDGQDWKKLPFPQPYGLPHFTDVNQSIIVAADKNALNKLNKMEELTTPDSVTGGYDYVALHELGHYFFFTLHQIDKEHWLNESLASYFMICFLRHNNLVLDIGKANAGYTPAHRSLEDFDKIYFRVGPQNYDWYQRQFLTLDSMLYPDLKTRLIQEVLVNYGSGGKNLDGISLMKYLDPHVMDAWLKSLQ
jgi:hypothetical protein